MEDEIEEMYADATADITAKWNEYMGYAQKRTEGLQKALDDAERSGDRDAIEKASEALKNAKINITLHDARYKEMIDTTVSEMARANQTALAYVNGVLPEVYRVNYNQAKTDAEAMGITFNILPQSTIAARVKAGDIKLPKKKIPIPKDKRWNTKQLNSSVLQGIIQGESMGKIAKRILPIVDNNETAAMRNARTMVTGAENEGRLNSYKDLEERGAIIKKVWIATEDSRTREWHLVMDGQEVDVDEPFVDGNGNEIMYPAEPDAAPETVYNCRCSMRIHYLGMREK